MFSNTIEYISSFLLYTVVEIQLVYWKQYSGEISVHIFFDTWTFYSLILSSTAYCIEVQSMMDAQQQQQQMTFQNDAQYCRGYPTTISNQLYTGNLGEDQPTYVDISESRPAACSISSIPTPQFEMSAITLSELNQAVPNPLHQNVYPSHQMSPVSNDSNLGSVGYGDEMSDSNHSDECMEDDHSRGKGFKLYIDSTTDLCKILVAWM